MMSSLSAIRQPNARASYYDRTQTGESPRLVVRLTLTAPHRCTMTLAYGLWDHVVVSNAKKAFCECTSIFALCWLGTNPGV